MQIDRTLSASKTYHAETRSSNSGMYTLLSLIYLAWIGGLARYVVVGAGCIEYRKVDSTARWRQIVTSSSIRWQCSDVIGGHSQENLPDSRRLSE